MEDYFQSLPKEDLPSPVEQGLVIAELAMLKTELHSGPMIIAIADNNGGSKPSKNLTAYLLAATFYFLLLLFIIFDCRCSSSTTSLTFYFRSSN